MVVQSSNHVGEGPTVDARSIVTMIMISAVL